MVSIVQNRQAVLGCPVESSSGSTLEAFQKVYRALVTAVGFGSTRPEQHAARTRTCTAILEKLTASGCGAAWLARLLGVQEVPGSNPGSPTIKPLHRPVPNHCSNHPNSARQPLITSSWIAMRFQPWFPFAFQSSSTAHHSYPQTVVLKIPQSIRPGRADYCRSIEWHS